MNKEELKKMHIRYTVKYKDTEKNQVHTKYNLTEHEAVNLWGDCKLYMNLEPISVSPEPDWNKYNTKK